MNKLEFFNDLKEKGISLSRGDNNSLIIKGDRSKLSSEITEKIRNNKAEILQLLDEISLSQRPRVLRKSRQGSFVPLSYAQQRLWFLDKTGAGASYNLPIAFNVKGSLDLGILKEVFRTIISRHEIIRTVYREHEGEVFQLVRDFSEVEFNLAIYDVSDFDERRRDMEVQRLIHKDVSTPFNLTDDLMVRVGYINVSHDSGVLMFNMHHIASDGWSIKILTEEFFRLYDAYTQRHENPLPALDIQYADYTYWQRDYLNGKVLDKQLAYWMKQLEGIPSMHGVPLDKTRPQHKQHQSDSIVISLPPSTASKLIQLARQHQLTPFMLLQGALALVVSRHANCDDIVMGTPIANRLQSELEPLIGFFANTLVLRVNTNQSTIADYFTHVRKVHLDAQSNQDVPFDKLVESMNLPRSMAYTPLIQILVTIDSEFKQNDNIKDSITIGHNLHMTAASYTMESRFDLEFCFNISEKGVGIRLLYDVSLFEKSRIEKIIDNLCRLLSELVTLESIAGKSLSAVSILSPEEQQQLLYGFNNIDNDYNRNICVHELFEHKASVNPDQIAVKFGEQEFTYKEVNLRSNKVAAYLRDNFLLKPDTLVGVCAEPSVEMLVGIIGIMKAGCAYVPLDPAYPQSQIEFILDDTNMTVILTKKKFREILSNFSTNTIYLDGIFGSEYFCKRYAGENIAPSSIGLSSDKLAYVIYTSGSTGNPKGVMVEHRSVINYLDNVKHYLNDQIECSVMSTSLSFDATVTSLFGAWLRSGYLTILPTGIRLFNELIKYICCAKASLFKLTPTHLLGLNLDIVIDTAHVFVIGGEPLSVELSKKLVKYLPNATFINEYGPTEATVGCSYEKFNSDSIAAYKNDIDIHIGRPIQNVQLYVLDRDRNMLPQGTIGELYIGGECLARGYLNLPNLTSERFIDSPFFESDKKNRSRRLYKTGDLVKHCSDGTLVFMGRNDDQIKIHGYRIEPGEIESNINNLDYVHSSLVMARNFADQKQLVAYVKYIDERVNGSEIEKIKNDLTLCLPDFKLPKFYIRVSSWPMTPSGKIDRKALPEVIVDILQTDFMAPISQTEIELVEIWSDILKISPEMISTTANFFELGGHSLALVKMEFKIRQKFSISHIDMADIFSNPKIKRLAKLIDFELGEKYRELSLDELEW